MTPIMRTVTIACVVEGHGEVQALPVLLRRIVAEIDLGVVLQVPIPYRANRSSLLRPDMLERVVVTQGDRVAGPGGVFILIDADDDCPAELGPRLVERAQAARRDRQVAVVLANREFEAWFLAAAPSLAGRRGLPDRLEAPDDAEAIRAAKEWLSNRMAHKSYKETSDQAAFTAAFDLLSARKGSPSLDKLWREVERLVRAGEGKP
jgi:Domain of unknown function (DUF4276)